MRTFFIVGVVCWTAVARAAGGYTRTDLSGQTDRGYSLAQQPWDEALVVAGLAKYGVSLGDFGLARYTSSGQPDLTFGNGGKVLTDFNGGTDQANAVIATERPRGFVTMHNLLAVGWATLGNLSAGPAMALYNIDGTLVSGFGSGGKVSTSFNGDGDGQFTAVTLDASKRIVVAGWSGPGIGSTNHDFIVARYTFGGALDPSFNLIGYRRLDIGLHSDDYATAVAVQGDGKIVIAGYSNNAPNTPIVDQSYFTFVRLNADGTLDASFGNGGRLVYTAFGGYARANAMAIQPDGKIVGAGFHMDDPLSLQSVAVVRLTGSGIPDSTFGPLGARVPHFDPTVAELGTALSIAPNGSLVVAGYNFDFDLFVCRLFPNGVTDGGFGLGGYQVVHATNDPAGQTVGHGVLAQVDGIKLAGYIADQAGQDFVILGLTSAGALDGSFGQ